MSKETGFKELQALLDKIDYYRDKYYNDNKSIISDKEYDELVDKATELSENLRDNKAIKEINRVGAYPSMGFKKVEHSKPMLSAAKTKDIDVIKMFVSKYNCYCSYKLDGLTLCLKYKDGRFVQGLTRGNGQIGEEVTEQCKLISNLPLELKLPFKNDLEIRGECVISWEEFHRINEGLEEPYSHPRNLAAGTIRTLDLSVLKDRKLSFVAFEVVAPTIEDKLEGLKRLEQLGFETVKTDCCDDLEKTLCEMTADNSVYPVDGLIFEVREQSVSEGLGSTTHHENCRIALKWQDTLYETTLRNIEWQTSKTGLINPVAVFDMIDLDGALTQRATLHNISYIEDLQLGIGDTIRVYRSNMVIPKVHDNITKSNTYVLPNCCPACGNKIELRKSNDTKTLHCTNPNCQAQLLSKLTHFVSKNCVNIPQLSTRTLKKFIEIGWVKNFQDIYRLKFHEKEMKGLNGFGEKSVNTLLAAIQDSRKIKLANFLYALSCPLLGKTASQLLNKEFRGDFKVFVGAVKTKRDFSNIETFGQIISESILTFFETNMEEIELLAKEFTFIQPIQESHNDNQLENKIFVITGSLNSFKNRDELIEVIVKNGGKVSGSVSKNTNYLINNDYTSSSSKNKKAQQLNIPIITEKGFLELL